MFDIGFSELLIIAVITLLVMGPERLPETVRTISLWFGRMKQMLSSARQELENEVGIDEIRLQLKNEKIMRQLDEAKGDIETTITDTKAALDNELSDARAELDEDLVGEIDDELDQALNEDLPVKPAKENPND